MFNSLRSRLILSYIIVILLTLMIAGAGLLLLLQDFQRGILKQRLSDALGPAAIQARTMANQGIAPTDITADLQDQVDKSWRVLVLDNTTKILADSQNELAGKVLTRAASVPNLGRRPFATGDQVVGGRDLSFAIAPINRPGKPQQFLVLAAVVRPFVGGLEELAQPLLTAGAIAMVVAILIALLLARSISEPLGQLTRASEAIARGNYEQQIPVRGEDEIGRLGASFNTMSRAVQHSQQKQKDFVANVSHELKTPLTSIQGFAQAIAEGATRDVASAQRAGKLIYAESQRMARLVGDLLTLARLDTGEVPLERETLDLASVLPAWVARFQSRAAASGVTLNLSVDSPPPIVGDAGRLEQVVANLIDNAIQYNHAGGRVDVRAAAAIQTTPAPRGNSRPSAEASETWAVIRVSDNGTGIPPSSLPRLFERFYRADRARQAGGSGLGLAIVKEIVAAHHGRVQVSSQEGEGTTFSVWLPAKGDVGRRTTDGRVDAK